MQCFDQANVIGRIAACLEQGSPASVQVQALRTLCVILGRDDFFSAHYREVVMQQFAEAIFDRCEELSVASETSREAFHLCCDITEKYLKQRDKLLDLPGNDSEDDGEAYYVPGSGLMGSKAHDQ